MKKKEISKDGTLYGLIGYGEKLDDGLTFYTENQSFIQVASWNYKKGKILGPHAHLRCERKSDLTQEFVYIKKGSLEATIYDNNDLIIANETLKEGDFIIIFNGGHRFRILEDNTEVLETKNGPYPGLEKDKRVIS